MCWHASCVAKTMEPMRNRVTSISFTLTRVPIWLSAVRFFFFRLPVAVVSWSCGQRS